MHQRKKYLKIGISNSNPIVIKNEELEEVNYMKYLGSLKTNDGDCTKKHKSKDMHCKKKENERT